MDKNKLKKTKEDLMLFIFQHFSFSLPVMVLINKIFDGVIENV